MKFGMAIDQKEYCL